MAERTAVLVVTAADKQLAQMDSQTAGVPCPFSFPLSGNGAEPASHYAANADGISDGDYAQLALYFGAGNPYGRVMRDGATEGFWDVLSELGLQRVPPQMF